MTRQHFFAAGLLATAISLAAPQMAVAGECKVKEPTSEAIADALKIGTVFDVQMTLQIGRAHV